MLKLSRYIPESPNYGNKRYLSLYSFLSILRDRNFWSDLHLTSSTGELMISLDGLDRVRGHGLLCLLLLSDFLGGRFGTRVCIRGGDEHPEIRALADFISREDKGDSALRVESRTFASRASARIKERGAQLGNIVIRRVDHEALRPLTRSILYGSLIGDLGRSLRSAVDLLPEQMAGLKTLTAELTENIHAHSGIEPDSGSGYLVLQRSVQGVAVSIGDAGIGIHRRISLQSAEPPTSNEAALARAFDTWGQRGACSLRSVKGLFGCTAWVEHMGGSLVLRSGSTAVRIDSTAYLPPEFDGEVVSQSIRSALDNPIEQSLLPGFGGTQLFFYLEREDN
jgi:hypothetical protein